MLSTFVQHHTRGLPLPAFIPTTASPSVLHSLLLSLQSPPTLSQIHHAANLVYTLEQNRADVSDLDLEELVLKKIIFEKLVVGLYAHALDIYLSEAVEAETEAEWWADVERSSSRVMFYLLQTLPLRLTQLTRTILLALRTRRLSLSFTSLPHLFPSTGHLRPNALITALFPHLEHHTDLSYLAIPSLTASQHAASAMTSFLPPLITQWMRKSFRLLNIPVELARHECTFKRKALEQIRDEKAEVLGTLSKMRGSVEAVLHKGAATQVRDTDAHIHALMDIVDNITCLADGTITSFQTPSFSVTLCLSIQQLVDATLRSHTSIHHASLRARNLLRPSRLTLLWPRPFFLLPLTLYTIRRLASSPASVAEIIREAASTVEGFLRGYLLEPLRDVVNTVRTGGIDGIIVRKEGIAADLDSLERMSLSLAQDKLHYNPEQLSSLSQQIRLGDLTPISQIYEEDIKSVWTSAVTGTLLRSALIQVQKAKVDIDRTLAGIDKLLRSQELTFAFVGIAPAFAIVYIVGGFVGNLWSVGRVRGKYGGKRRRAGAWFAMRRLERLLISDPSSNSMNDDIPASTAGLLLLSLTRLRAFAETCLPAHSQLREGFLQDVEDLEDPRLRRGEKLRIVDRMWRSWGSVLKWGSIMEEVK